MGNFDKTIKQLMQLDLNSNSWDSGLIKKVEKFINQPLKSLDIEALRVLIGQNIGLEYLIPLAIDKLKENILAEGDLYEGDLFKNVLDCNRQFWVQHKDYYKIVVDLYVENILVFESDNAHRQIRKSFEIFNKLQDVV
jgi:hypothetical protein